MLYDVIVIGGGASGIISAIYAHKTNPQLKICLVEKNNRMGKKILVTGNGRCNLTNINADVSNYHGKNPRFVMSALSKMNVYETMDFFESIGVVAKTEDDGKVYPYSLQASSVVDALRYELDRTKCQVFCDTDCKEIRVKEGIFFLYCANGKVFNAKKVIFATGSIAGIKGDVNGSYSVVENLGHKKTNLIPALVQLKTADKKCASMKGVKVMAKASAYVSGNFIREEYGEVLFTEYGLSGPPVFSLSRIMSEGVSDGNVSEISLNLMPDKSVDEIYMHLLSRRRDVPLENYLLGMMNKFVGIRLIKDITEEKLTHNATILNDNILYKLATLISDWRFEISGTNSFESAQVVAGGIETADFNPSTMESGIVPGLYLAGEVLDIDGDCGGFNLQWAWSSGAVAGRSAAETLS